jgi:hypothetical protein
MFGPYVGRAFARLVECLSFPPKPFQILKTCGIVRRGVTFSLVGLWCCGLQAQSVTGTSTSSVSRDATAIQVLSAAVQSSGSPTNGVLDTKATGRIVTPDGQTGQFTSQSLGPRAFVNQLTLGTTQSTLIVSGDDAHVIRNGKRSSLPVWIAQSSRLDFLPAAMVAGYIANADLSVTNVGPTSIDGVSYQQLHILKTSDKTVAGDIDQQIFNLRVFIDPTTRQIARVRTRSLSPNSAGNGIETDIAYDDYRAVDGMMVPFHITYLREKTKDMELFLDSFTAHAGNSTSLLQ